MKKLFRFGCAWVVVMVAARAAEESFSKAVRPEDFSAAGLAKLSPGELARLDALVRDYKSGASAVAEAMADRLAAAKREAEAAEKARAAAEARATKAAADAQAAEARATEARAARAEPAKPAEGLLTRAKKVLVPAGAQIEVAGIESRIVGDFTGWRGKAIFTLENGQRWQMANADEYYTPAIKSPAVKIAPASFGGFWMTIEGVSQRVRVVPVGGN
jgi:hypothetical protein